MRGQKLLTPQDVTEPAGEDEMPMPPRKRIPSKKQMRPMPPTGTRMLTPQDVPEPVRYAKGGVTRADGCAQRGKTRGRMV